ncbi:MAG: type II secretion system protein, partial [Planctomycetota bacterium]
MTRTEVRRSSDPRHHRGFSLIELLIVLGVVSLLIGLLVPALQGARGQSRTAACGSNLRQLALANLQYSNEHRGQFAPGASEFRQNLNRWHGTRTSPYESFTPEGGPLSAFLGPDGAVRRCPSFEVIEAEPGIDFEAGCGG